jgi:LemA protein
LTWLILLILLLAPPLWALIAYNRLIRLRNQTRTAWADIDVQLTRRHDLVPQLVSTVQAAAQHEQATLSRVTELRAQALALSSPAALGAVELQLEQAIGRLFALREAYPELRVSENFLALQRDLVQIEDHLQMARRFYNGAVRDYNDAVQRVPDLLVARAGGFIDAEFYQARDSERAAAQVQLP